VAQLTVACAPVNGKVVAVEWLKLEGIHIMAVWHILQSVGYFARAWFGVFVML
jgi:hypothetical protein